MTEQTQNNDTQPVSILGQFVKDLSFENPDPIAFLALSNAQPEMNMDVSINANTLTDGHFEDVLKIKLTAKHKDKTIFICELSYSTVLKIDEEAVGKENIGSILMVHIPHLAFPFVRTILYNIVREGGLPPFAIHPIDFEAMYQQNNQTEPSPTLN